MGVNVCLNLNPNPPISHMTNHLCHRLTVLPKQVIRRRPQHQININDTRLAEPVRVHPLRAAGGRHKGAEGGEQAAVARGRGGRDVHPGLGRVQPEQAHREVGAVGEHEGNGAVEGHGAVQLVLEHVQVVEAVGVARGGRGAERERVCVLRQAEDVAEVVEGGVEAEGLGTVRLSVRVRLECLLPHVRLCFRLRIVSEGI